MAARSVVASPGPYNIDGPLILLRQTQHCPSPGAAAAEYIGCVLVPPISGATAFVAAAALLGVRVGEARHPGPSSPGAPVVGERAPMLVDAPPASVTCSRCPRLSSVLPYVVGSGTACRRLNSLKDAAPGGLLANGKNFGMTCLPLASHALPVISMKMLCWKLGTPGAAA